jgi:hypothetical protein
MCIGNRHGYRSHHVRSIHARWAERPLLRGLEAILGFGTEVFRP